MERAEAQSLLTRAERAYQLAGGTIATLTELQEPDPAGRPRAILAAALHQIARQVESIAEDLAFLSEWGGLELQKAADVIAPTEKGPAGPAGPVAALPLRVLVAALQLGGLTGAESTDPSFHLALLIHSQGRRARDAAELALRYTDALLHAAGVTSNDTLTSSGSGPGG